MQTGTVIDDKYEITGTIGVGGFGSVYSAIQRQLERRVAVKCLNTTLLMERDGSARFEREAKAINALHHKNIVAFYGYGAWQGAPYMVMEYVEGPSLDRLIREEQKIDPLRALRLGKQILEGLAAAHAAGVVHRDLKPSNIIVTRDADGTELVKIIDFGLAKLMPGYGIAGQKLTETGYALGTCFYMPPEQALGVPVDGRADIYSVGCILYHVLTGSVPFYAEDNVAVMMQHIHNQPAPLAEFLSPPAPVEAVASFVRTCMAKDQAQRYQTCGDAIRDLEAVLDGRYTMVVSHAVPEAQAAPAARSVDLRILLAGAVSLVAVVCGLAFLSWSNQQEGVNQIAAETRAALLRNKDHFVKYDYPILDADARTLYKVAISKNRVWNEFTPDEQLRIAAGITLENSSSRMSASSIEFTKAQREEDRLLAMVSPAQAEKGFPDLSPTVRNHLLVVALRLAANLRLHTAEPPDWYLSQLIKYAPSLDDVSIKDVLGFQTDLVHALGSRQLFDEFVKTLESLHRLQPLRLRQRH